MQAGRRPAAAAVEVSFRPGDDGAGCLRSTARREIGGSAPAGLHPRGDATMLEPMRPRLLRAPERTTAIIDRSVRSRALGPRLAALTAAALVGGGGGPAPARAGDGETAVSAAVGFATYATPGEEDDEMLTPTAGATLQATYERGLGDYAAVRAPLAGAVYGGGGVAGTGLATVGLSYRLDVLRYVPYAAVGVGLLVRGGGPFATGVEPALELGGGVDVLRGRARSWGVAAAITSFASDTTTVTVTVRSTWRWGYF